MSQIFKCAQCSQLLDDALILTCDHNLCLPCAALALRRSQASGNSRGVTCHICQAFTLVDPASISQLLDTPVHSGNANASYNAQPSSLPVSGNSKFCGHCETEPATVNCSKCQEVFCEECCNNIHRRGRFTTHTILPITQIPSSPNTYKVAPPSQYSSNVYNTSARGSAAPNPSYGRNSVAPSYNRGGIIACKEHPDESVQYFCMQCEQPCVCAECVIHGVHKDHDVLNIKKAYPAIRGKVEEFLYGIAGQVEEIILAEQKIDQHRRELSAAINGAKQHLSKSFEDVRQKLTKKEHELQLNADSILAEAMGELDAHARNAREKARSLEDNSSKIRSHMSGSDPVALLNYYAEVKSNLHQTVNSSDSITATRVPDAAARKVVLAVEQCHAHADSLQGLLTAVGSLRGLEIPPESHQPGINVSNKKH